MWGELSCLEAPADLQGEGSPGLSLLPATRLLTPAMSAACRTFLALFSISAQTSLQHLRIPVPQRTQNRWHCFAVGVHHCASSLVMMVPCELPMTPQQRCHPAEGFLQLCASLVSLIIQCMDNEHLPALLCRKRLW